MVVSLSLPTVTANRQREAGTGQKSGMTEYETEVELSVRYRDIDSVGHVNNAVYVSYLEEARVAYIKRVFGVSAVDPGFVVAHISVDYERPIELGETVIVALGVTALGESSITMTYEIRADGARAATAETVIVPFDREAGTSRPVPDEWRDQIERYEGRSF
jgi:acyl-CoA thioester hydrolase